MQTHDLNQRLRVRTLGRFEVTHGDAVVPAALWRRRPVLTLFTCLLSVRDHRLHREQLMDALWPEAELPVATRELHRAMHALRAIVDRPGHTGSALSFEGDMITLRPAGTDGSASWLDADEFSMAATAALLGHDVVACGEALARYSGDFLPDDPYSEWVSVRRAALQSQHLALMLHMARLCGSAGDLEQAERYLRAVLSRDACQEEAAATLMGLLAAAGRRVDALRVYHMLAAALETSMDLAPNSDIEALRARLQTLEGTPVAAALPPKGNGPAEVGNLPAPLTSFVGRAWEQTEIMSLLAGSRLVTLTGPGGCGKTRLALEAAGRLHARFPDGVWLVELAALQDETLVPWAAAAAMGTLGEMKGLAGDTLVDALCAFLRPRRALLVLDNCEHLLGASAHLTTAILRACPSLAILATSREVLGIAGETTMYVPPLAVPPSTDIAIAGAMDFEAVSLFVERARASQSSFALTRTNAADVLMICRRLDGLPLALELAAARLGMLTVEALAARLHDCFALLTGGNRTALPRQQTLRATMDWSYGLLADQERVLLRRLAVFVGGWTLEAAAAICRENVTAVPGVDAGQSLDELVARSLVLVTHHGDESRYGLLETTRQYAHDQLAASGELRQIQARHRQWFLDLLRQAGAAARTDSSGIWLDRLEQDFANLRQALSQSDKRPEDAREILQQAEPITRLCLVRGHIEEGRDWLDQALANDPEATPARAMALNAAGSLASEQGDYPQANAHYEEGYRLYMSLGDSHGAARVLINHGIVKKYQGAPGEARALCESGCLLARDQGDPTLLAIALNNLGTLAIERGDTVSAKAVLEESLTLKRQSGSQAGIVQVLINLGEVARADRDLLLAGSRYQEALSHARLLGNRAHIALLHYNLALVAAAEDAPARAAVEFQAALKQEQDLGNKRQIAANLEGMAGVAMSFELVELGCRLLGAAELLREQIGAPVPDVDTYAYERNREKAGNALGAAAASAWSAGRVMGVEAAIAEALKIAA